jgi:uncharacterized protein (TIGR03437 family)
MNRTPSHIGTLKDQVNVQLPASLAGRGDVPVILSVTGKQANTARLTFQ